MPEGIAHVGSCVPELRGGVWCNLGLVFAANCFLHYCPSTPCLPPPTPTPPRSLLRQAPDAALIAHVGGLQRVYNSVLSEMLEPLVAKVRCMESCVLLAV